MSKLIESAVLVVILGLGLCVGCGQSGTAEKSKAEASSAGSPSATSQPAKVDASSIVRELHNSSTDPAQLLAACLPQDQLQAGWVRLFDGQSLWGWFFTGNANWRVVDGAIRVDQGEPSFLCTSFQIADYELLVDFKCSATTNSGIFLRTTASPQDVARECYELNIAPADNPFPTGSLVKRQKVDPATIGEVSADQWHTYRFLVEGNHCQVWLDGKAVMDYSDPQNLRRGHISLQHNQGAVEFRNILLRPIGTKALPLDKDWESAWTKAEKPEAKLDVTVEDTGLRLKGGSGQLESKELWSDFVLQATYQLASPEVNSGIFFRCIPGNLLDGYECQLNHALEGDSREAPKDYGAGAIFNRQRARVVVGDGVEPTYVTIIAEGNQIATWINGLWITDFADTRTANANPRRGARTEAGSIALQGHDATTEVLFRSVAIGPIATNAP